MIMIIDIEQTKQKKSGLLDETSLILTCECRNELVTGPVLCLLLIICNSQTVVQLVADSSVVCVCVTVRGDEKCSLSNLR